MQKRWRPVRLLLLGFAVSLTWLTSAARGADVPSRATLPVLLDTDLGGDIDDAFALALLLASPELDLRGVTTVHGDAHTRALVACRFLHAVGRGDVPVASGSPPREQPDSAGQLQYGLRPGPHRRPEREPAVEFLYGQLRARPGETTLLAIGPLTNLGELLSRHPDCKPWIKRIVLMGGAVRVGYDDRATVEAEWNVRSDVRAAQTVFASGIPLVVAPLDATANVKLEEPLRTRIFRTETPMGRQLHALYQLWDKLIPTLFDPVAVTLCFEERFCGMEDLHLEVDARGFTRVVPGKPNARVATSIHRDEFLRWFVERLTRKPTAPAKPAREPAPAGKAGRLGGPLDINRAGSEELQRLPGIGPKLAERILQARRSRPFGSVEDLRWVPGIGPKTLERLLPHITVYSEPLEESALVGQGGMPARVHVIEDFETDSGRPPWLCGKAETANVPPGSRRACRGVWTNDFDDRLSDPAAVYTAVALQPVPRPVAGNKTLLSFRYWLKGTTRMRVQVQSLTRGYHRGITLADLVPGSWQSATVDLTAARRPDGGGGPLTAGEHLGLVQFYADAAAELVIDDVLLYEPAAADETRPFPRRPIFTAWFEAGRPGKEWPGDLEIVKLERPAAGRAARSVLNAQLGVPWIRLALGGGRTLGGKTALRFRYLLTGASSLRVQLVGPSIPEVAGVELKDLSTDRWAEATLDLTTGSTRGNRVEEIRFLLPAGAELLLDHVLLYEPADQTGP